MISFQQAVFPLLLGSFLIVAGYITSFKTEIRNTGFPCLLRLIIWILFKLYPDNSAGKETLAFLLDHPRRCFTLLFPSSATWWLFAILAILNLMDLFFFLVLDLGDNYISAIPIGYRILDGFFQVFPSLQTLIIGCINSNSRICSYQFTIITSCCIG
jgi:Trk-type K+ transport system membrane component